MNVNKIRKGQKVTFKNGYTAVIIEVGEKLMHYIVTDNTPEPLRVSWNKFEFAKDNSITWHARIKRTGLLKLL